MTEISITPQSLFTDCWQSFRSLPAWVQIWVTFLLMPVNMASLYFINEPMGIWIAILANIGMMLNLPVIFYDRGFSKLMAVPHLIPWTMLVVLLVAFRPEVNGFYQTYLSVLLAANVISLLFDYRDAVSWLRGDRTVAGR
jgi:hypothetical protein